MPPIGPRQGLGVFVDDIELSGAPSEDFETGVGRQVHLNLLPAAAVAGEGVAVACQSRRVTGRIHIVAQEGMDLVYPTRQTTLTRVGSCHAVHIGQRCPYPGTGYT